MEMLLTASTHSAVFWDLEMGMKTKTLEWSKATRSVNAAIFSNDGKRIATGGRDRGAGAVMIWDSDSGQVTQTLRHSHPTENGIDLLAFSADGRVLAATSDATSDATSRDIDPVNVWDLETGSMNWTLTDHRQKIECLAISPDGRLAVTGSYPTTMWRLHNIENAATPASVGIRRE